MFTSEKSDFLRHFENPAVTDVQKIFLFPLAYECFVNVNYLGNAAGILLI